MNSTAAGAAAVAPLPNGRKQHKPSSSLGSLYEVLADLDETQLEYLLQEMNHTGHQNVKVSQAVSAYDSQSPPESLSAIRASMLPPAPGLERQSSKSQQGKLRLQTAFQRTPSLRKTQQADMRGSQPTSSKPAHDAAIEDSKGGQPKSRFEQQPSIPDSSLLQAGITKSRPSEPEIKLPKRGATAGTASSSLPTTSSVRTTSAAYKRIPRPDFSLPPGITVPDLLQLLETEFLSSSLPDTASPASVWRGQHSPSPPFPTTSPSISLSSSPVLAGRRTLRKHSSRLDMALDAERNASAIEEIGLGMLEPRGSPLARSSRGVSAPIVPTEPFARGFGTDTPPNSSPVVLEGIFDVLENR
jgi:hypothetical protein